MRAVVCLPALVLVLVLVLASASAALAGGSERAQTVSDPALGITWLADADLASTDTFHVAGINADGSMDYATARAWVRAMNASDYLGHANWTLPTTPTVQPGCQSRNKGNRFGFGCATAPLGALYYGTLKLREPDTAVAISGGTAGPFSDFQPYLYWTATIAANHSQGYRTFSFNTGWAGSNVAKHDMYVLPMIAGNPFGTSPGDGTGLQPSADGKTVYDPATDVTWLADADLARTETFGVTGINRDGSMQRQTATRWIARMRAAQWLGQKGWQLPVVSSKCGGFGCTRGNPFGELYYVELHQSQGQDVATVPDTSQHGLRDIQPYLYWSCQGQTAQGPCAGSPKAGMAWSFSFGNGFEGTDLIQNDLYVMVYYPSPRPPLPVKPHPTCPAPKPGQPITCK